MNVLNIQGIKKKTTTTMEVEDIHAKGVRQVLRCAS